jgi:glycosyltransferase involved in cell wall biosynthesis
VQEADHLTHYQRDYLTCVADGLRNGHEGDLNTPRKRLSILHVTPLYAPAWQFGGPVRSTHEIATGLAARGHHVTVVTTSCGPPDEASPDVVRKVVDGVNVSYCPWAPGPFGLISRAMRTVAKGCAAQADVAHVTGVWQPSVSRVYGDLHAMRVPYVSSPRGALSPYSFRQGWLKKFLYFQLFEQRFAGRAATLHATAPLEEAELRRLFPNVAMAVIPNACDPAKWYSDQVAGAAWRERHGISPDELVFAHVGRIHPKKNLDFLVDVAASLPASGQWRLVFYGPTAAKDRPYRSALADRFPPGRLVIADGAGDTGETRAAYSGADVLVFPSLHENFGNVLVESLLCGTPVVSSPNVGAAAFFARTEGVRVLDLDAPTWARELSEQVAVGRDQSTAEHGRAIAAATFSPGVVAEHFESLYLSLARSP